MTRRYDTVKRLIDLAVAGIGLFASLPLQAALAGLIRLKLGSPVLFRQVRPGLHGIPFTMVKFRSMKNVDESRGLVTDAQRLTPFGKMLRSTSLDELPTLWNVVKGDMSVVGPRPLLLEYLDRYTQAQARRHDVRPGITGLAQVSGRNTLSWEAKFLKDIQYVDQRSLGLDAKIVLHTIVKVLRRDGVAADGDVTMPEFMGTSNG